MRTTALKVKAKLIALTLTLLGSWATGYLGICPLTGKRMWLTEKAATRDALLWALAQVGVTGDAAEALADEAAGRVTGSVDAAHAPVAASKGGHRMVLTDARAQQALGDGITPHTEDALSIDDRETKGATDAAKKVSALRAALS